MICAMVAIVIWAAYEYRLRQLREAVAIGALVIVGVCI
jgi:hypothetical protein